MGTKLEKFKANASEILPNFQDKLGGLGHILVLIDDVMNEDGSRDTLLATPLEEEFVIDILEQITANIRSGLSIGYKINIKTGEKCQE